MQIFQIEESINRPLVDLIFILWQNKVENSDIVT